MSLRHRLAHCGLVAAVVACLLIFFPRENVMRTAVLLCAVSPQPEALEWGASMRHFKASLIVLSPLGEAHPIGHTYFEQTRVLHVDLRSPLEGITRRFLWREALPVLNEADDEAAAVVFDAAALRICGEVIGALLQRTRGVVLLRHVSMDQADAVVDAYRAALVGTLGDVRAAQLQKRWPYPISPHFVAGRAAAVRRFVALVEAELRRVPDGFPATGGVVSAADAMSSEITLVEVPLHWAEQGCDRLAQCNGEHPVVVREGCDERACASSYHSFVTLEVPQSLPETLFDVIHDRRVVDLWERHEVLSWQPAAKEERFSHCRNGRPNVVITMEGGYPLKQLETFLASFFLWRIPGCTHLVLLVKDMLVWRTALKRVPKSVREELIVVELSELGAGMATSHCGLLQSRPEYVHRWLRREGHRYHMAMLVDCRDVVFQRDAFDGAPTDGGEFFAAVAEYQPSGFFDPYNILAHNAQRWWVADRFSYAFYFASRLAAADQIRSSFPIICAGLYFGTVRAMLDATEVFFKTIAVDGNCPIDQGVFFGLMAGGFRRAGLRHRLLVLNPDVHLYRHRPRSLRAINVHTQQLSTSELVARLGRNVSAVAPSAGVARLRVLRNCKNRTYSVVHQLDRFPELWRSVQAPYIALWRDALRR